MRKIVCILSLALSMTILASCSDIKDQPQAKETSPQETNTPTVDGTASEIETDTIESSIDIETEADTEKETEAINETPSSEFIYKENDDGTITISKYTGSSTDVVVPSTIDGKNVTEIGAWCFQLNRTLISVTLPDSIVKIGSGAFVACSALTKVELPPHLAYIGGSAFEYCTNLSNIVLPNTLTYIGTRAFAECSALKSVVLPSKLVDCGEEIFNGAGIETVEFENGLEVIPVAAFANTQLKTVVLPSSIRILGASAFAGCNQLLSITLNDGLISVGNHSLAGASQLTEIIIPASVNDITELAFDMCRALQKVKFEGNAPQAYVYAIEGMEAYDVDYIVYYHADKIGFTSPEWNGYSTELW